MQDRTSIGPKRKIAFVCSGGATKAGAFHLGVALALQEQGFSFLGGLIPPTGHPAPPAPMQISTYVGSSAGSIIASYLAAGYSIDNIFNSFLYRKQNDDGPQDAKPLPRLTYQKMFKLRPGIAKEQFGQLLFFRKILSSLTEGNWEALLQLKWLKATGIFSTAGIEQYLREEVLPSNRFQDYQADLFICATQLNHSRKVVFGKYHMPAPAYDPSCQYNNDVGISDACAASTALPVIFSPYTIRGENDASNYYIDGEIRDTLSSHVAIDSGCDLVIASYTHQPYHLNAETGSLTDHGIPAIVIQTIYLVIEQKINQFIHNKVSQRNAINAVEKYMKECGLDAVHQHKILGIMESELHHRRGVDTIYIHPNPDDASLFFGEHFSLSSKKMSDIVRSGFRATIDTLKQYEFADKVDKPAMGTTGT